MFFFCRFEFKSATELVYRDNDNGEDTEIDLLDRGLSFDTMLGLSAYVFNTPEDECEPRLLKLLGRYLFDLILPESQVPALRERIITSCKRGSARIELLFRPDAAQYAQLPWEFLMLPGPDKRRFLGEITNVTVTLMRYLPTQRQIRPAGKRLRLLIDVASPEDQPEILFDKLENTLKTLKRKSDDKLDFRLERNRSLEEIEQDLREFRPDIYHFSGHGEHDALWLARRDREDTSMDDVRKARAVFGFRAKISDDAFKASIDTITKLFAIDDPPQLVVLDACNSDWSWLSEMLPGVAHQLVEHVPAVVAMRYPISNQSAERFSVRLYERILEGWNLDEAVQSARNSLYISDPSRAGASSRAFGTPVLYLNSSAPLCDTLIASGGPSNPQSQPKVQIERQKDCPNCAGDKLFTGGRCIGCGIRFACPACRCRFEWHQLKAVVTKGDGYCPDNDGKDCEAAIRIDELIAGRVGLRLPTLSPLEASGLVATPFEPPTARRFGQPPLAGDVA